MNMIKTLKSLPMALAAAAILAATPVPEMLSGVGTAQAMQEKKKKQETRKVPAMSIAIHKQVQKAQEAMDLKDLPKAKEILARALQQKKINDYERAVVWQVTAMIAFEEDDTRGTIRAYEQILRFRESIAVAFEMQILYGLAQLYYSQENYDKALELVNEWEARQSPEFIGVSQLTFISQLHYVRENFPSALSYIDRTIALAQSVADIEVKENWYGLKLSAHYELGQYSSVRDTLEILLINWPKPQYWIQLAGVYQELNDEDTFYSLMEAAYKQGFLDDKPNQLENVAQIQMSRSAPIKCAWILDRAFREQRVDEDAQNLKTLGQCYMLAAEFGRAVSPLTKAAEKENDPDLWFQIGQVQMAEDNLKGAITALEKAIDGFADKKNAKNKERRFTAMMLRAQALIELKRYKEANSAFAAASKLADKNKQKRTIRQWRGYLKNEEAREKMLTGD
jgi:tetratricopeptide (TPR) repeat protein